MNKLLFFLMLAFLPVCAQAMESVWRSSTTMAGVPVGVLCAGSRNSIVYKVIISSAGGQASGMTLADSSFTFTNVNQLGPIDPRSLGSYEYRAVFPGGLIYTSTGTQVSTILYDCY